MALSYVVLVPTESISQKTFRYKDFNRKTVLWQVVWCWSYPTHIKIHTLESLHWLAGQAPQTDPSQCSHSTETREKHSVNSDVQPIFFLCWCKANRCKSHAAKCRNKQTKGSMAEVQQVRRFDRGRKGAESNRNRNGQAVGQTDGQKQRREGETKRGWQVEERARQAVRHKTDNGSANKIKLK